MLRSTFIAPLKSRIRSIAVGVGALAAFAAMGTSAHATVYSLTPAALSEGVPSSVAVFDTNTSGSPVTFTDDFTFNVTDAIGGLFAAAIIDTASGPFAVTSADLTLFSGTPGSGTFVSTTHAFDPLMSPTLTADLSTGAYYLEAMLTTPAKSDAVYSIVGTAISAAPEPATWALLMMGVGVAGFAMRRAKSRKLQPVQA